MYMSAQEPIHIKSISADVVYQDDIVMCHAPAVGKAKPRVNVRVYDSRVTIFIMYDHEGLSTRTSGASVGSVKDLTMRG